MDLCTLSNEDLLTGLYAVCGTGRRLLAQVLVFLAEVEERRIHLLTACSSMFDFCTRRLGLSEGEACLRITAARLVRRFPRLLDSIERGDLHLSALALLRRHLTDENLDELVTATSRKSKREVESLLAARYPRPAPKSLLRTLPTHRQARSNPEEQPARDSVEHATPRVAGRRLETLSGAYHRLHLTINNELRTKLERAAELMRHQNPVGDLAVVVERALDLLLARLERERTPDSAPTKRKPATARRGHVTRAVRREVFARDGDQCTFVDEHGRRCPSRAFLELDHIRPRAHGGTGASANLRVRCANHNRLYAEQTFGRAHVERRRSRGPNSGPGPKAPATDPPFASSATHPA